MKAMKEKIQKEIGKVEPVIKRRSRKEGIKMQSGISKMPIASVKDGDKIGQIILERLTRLPFCEMCNSFDCIHVKYAMSFEQVRINLVESLKRICPHCGNYNTKDADYCVNCGSKVIEVQ